VKKQDRSLHIAIGNRLKYHRNRLRITTEQLAEQIDVTPRYLQDVEKGKVGLSLTTIANISKVLEISTDSLLYDEPAGIDAMIRGMDKEKIEFIEDLVRLQLKIFHFDNNPSTNR
jgi:transcriptional regulator with XRE-family HTH domain